MRPRRIISGLTLKESLVVLAVIALLAATAYPVYRLARHRALEVQCRANLWAIYLKYNELKGEHKVGTYEFRKAFTQWLRTPEAMETVFCPLSPRRERYNFNERMTFVKYNIEIPKERLFRTGISMDARKLVAYCGCHRLPYTGKCRGMMESNEKFLAIFDNGEIRYASLAELREWVTSKEELLALLEYISRQHEFEE